MLKDGVVAGSGVARRIRLSRKQLLYGAVVVVLLLTVSGGIWYTATRNKPAQPQKTSKPSLQTGLASAEPTAAQLGGSQKALDAKLAQATTAQAKSDIYLQKMSLGLTLNEAPGHVLSYAQQAEALAPSRATAYALATVYQRQGDRAKAAGQYRIYISRMDAAYKAAHPADVEHYTQVAVGLEAQP